MYTCSHVIISSYVDYKRCLLVVFANSITVVTVSLTFVTALSYGISVEYLDGIGSMADHRGDEDHIQNFYLKT